LTAAKGVPVSRGPPPASAVGDQTVSIEHGVDRADRWTREVGPPLAQPLAELRCAPRRVVLLEADDQGFDGRWQLIRVPIRPATPIAEAADADPLIPLRDLVPGLSGNAELVAQGRHRLAVHQTGDEPRTLIHNVTLLPRHAPSC
jgi:hypothetical protein